MTESTATIPESLSSHVREATATEHTEAENSAFIVALMGGDVPLAGYVGYLQQLRAVYELLEGIVNDDRHGDVMGAFHDPGLERLQAIETDLDWLELELDASDAQAPATVLPATRTYLGDLSGGFFVGKRIREIYGLTPDGGASVFDFPEIVGPGAWKQRYRDNLDALDWSAEERQAFVDEAKAAYLHHSKVFDELAEL